MWSTVATTGWLLDVTRVLSHDPAMKLFTPLSDERRLKVYDELRQGSSPQSSFFLLVAVSTLLAAFGLVMNSTAVVIGAMLVAPLMTPILGLGLGLVRGDTHLIGIALRAEVTGVAVSILAGAALGVVLPTGFEPTHEMLSRTTPNLFDLLVAILAGLAGAYALVDEKISPVLPGVAISVAIVPPLANCGLSLALGAYEGAAGSFLLFFANFLSILLVSALVFYLAKMAEVLQPPSGSQLAKRFYVAIIGFVVVAVLLSFELNRMFENRRLHQQITQTLQHNFTDRRINELADVNYQTKEGALLVFADVKAPDVVSPRTVNTLQQRLQDALKRPVELYVRTAVTHDVSSVGSVNQAINETLDGYLVAEPPNRRIAALRTAEQVIREYMDDRRGIGLKNLRLFPIGSQTALIAEVSGVRRISAEEIEDLEGRVQARLTDTNVAFAVQQDISELVDHLGGVRLEFNMPKQFSEEQREIGIGISEFVKDWMTERSFSIHSWSVTILDGIYHMLFEVKGPVLVTDKDLKALQQGIAGQFDIDTKVYVRSEIETVVGPGDYASFAELLNDFRARNRAEYGAEIRQSVIHSR